MYEPDVGSMWRHRGTGVLFQVVSVRPSVDKGKIVVELSDDSEWELTPGEWVQKFIRVVGG
jgi:hypothetical protein